MIESAYDTKACSTSCISGASLNCLVLWSFEQAAAVECD